MLVFTHPACLQHDPGRGHPECPARLQGVIDALKAAYPDQLDWREAPPAKLGELARVHDSELIDLVLKPQTEALRLIDMDTMTSPGSASAALHAAGAGVAAVDAVMLGQDPVAFCAVRPPGHHASANTAMGFCAVRAHRESGNRPVRQTPPGARPNRDPLARPALDPGRLLERCGDVTPRGMTVHDRTRLIGRLRPFIPFTSIHAWRGSTHLHPRQGVDLPTSIHAWRGSTNVHARMAWIYLSPSTRGVWIW